MLLLIDNDAYFLGEAQDFLNFGRGVLLAKSGDRANDLMAVVGDRVSVAMINIDLPGKNGKILVQEFHQHYPKVPLIAIGSAQKPEALEAAKLLGAQEALHKPMSIEWRAAIRRAKDRQMPKQKNEPQPAMSGVCAENGQRITLVADNTGAPFI